MLNDTIFALSSPPGVGAIALIRLSGQKALQVVDGIFSKSLENAKPNSVMYGEIIHDKQTIDEVVLSIFKAPHSFTGEDVVEINCHGSAYIQQTILDILHQNGARLAEAGEFSKRTLFNGKMDLSQTEAIADLIHANSKNAHRLALEQMKGGVSNELKTLRAKLLDFVSLLELELDFSEEDVEFVNRGEMVNSLEETRQYIDKLIQSFRTGNAIKNGVPTSIVGKPNSGKSTLLNALLNEERAIVSHIAGTTRDTIEEVVVINDFEFRLIDTAGIRQTNDEIEQIGVEKAKNIADKSRLCLCIFDMETTEKKDIENFLNAIDQPRENVLLIGNKSDLISSKSDFYDIEISAKTGLNITELKTKIVETMNFENGENQVLITNIRHIEALENAKTNLVLALDNLQNKISSDLVAMDIRQVLHHIGTITGEVTTDEMLGHIFSNFCIGK